MNTMNKSTHFFLILLLIFSCKPQNESTLIDPFYQEVVNKLEDAIAYEISSKDLNALSMVLVVGEEIIWNKSFGFKDEAKTIKADENIVYRVGSVSKLFTDIAIMQKVEKGELDLDAPIPTYLPEFSLNSSSKTPITLRMLTSHRSGMLREPKIGNYFDAQNDNLKETVNSIINSRQIYEPGTQVKYSNAGIGVVGYVLEKMYNQPYVSYMSENVLDKIGMTKSAFNLNDNISSNLAEATMWSYDGRIFKAPTFQLGMSPAGSLYAPMNDLGLFLISLFKGGVGVEGRYISEKTLYEMWSPQFGGTKTDGYGIGFRLGDFNGHQKVGHGGAIYGFSTQLSAVPELKLGVACASSVDITNSITGRLSQYALDLLFAANNDQELPNYNKTEPVSIEQQNLLAGYYQSDKGAFEIIRKKDKLILNGDKSELELRQSESGIISDGRSNYGSLNLIVNEGSVVINGTEYIKSSPPTKSDYPADWNNLIGEYGDDHIILYIYEKEGDLFALIEWFEKDKLNQLSKNEFAFPESGGMYHGEKFIFERNAQDFATSVSIENGPVFKRRDVGASTNETFKIKPVMSRDELIANATSSKPPQESGDFKESDLVELKSLDSSIKYDIRYASKNNFMGMAFYTQSKAFLQRPAAEALVRVHQNLKKQGYGLLIHDAYRPWTVTKMFWDATPEDKKIFVADPENGSRHNRGAAVDLTLYALETGKVIEMVAGYDEMTDRSFPFYYGGNTEQRYHRALLRTSMEVEGFTVYDFEWWHFDYKDWKSYRIGNQQFEEF